MTDRLPALLTGKYPAYSLEGLVQTNGTYLQRIQETLQDRLASGYGSSYPDIGYSNLATQLLSETNGLMEVGFKGVFDRLGLLHYDNVGIYSELTAIEGSITQADINICSSVMESTFVLSRGLESLERTIDDGFTDLAQITESGFHQLTTATQEGFDQVDRRLEQVASVTKTGLQRINETTKIGLANIEIGLLGLTDELHQGFLLMDYQLCYLQDGLRDLVNVMATPLQTQAKEAVAIALDCFNANQFEEAEKFFLRTIDANPTVYQAYLFLGLISYHHWNMEDAAKYLSKAAAFAKGKHKALPLRWLAIVQFDLARYDESLRSIEAALSIHPDSATLHFYRGVITARLEDMPLAVESFTEAIRLNIQLALVLELWLQYGLVPSSLAGFIVAVRLREGLLLNRLIAGAQQLKRRWVEIAETLA